MLASGWKVIWTSVLFCILGVVISESDSDYRPYNRPAVARSIFKKTSKSKVERLGRLLKRNVQRLRDNPNGEVELVFLVDSSASVGQENFFDELKFVKKLLSDFTVDINRTRVSVITFSSQTRVVRHVDHLTIPSPAFHKCSLLEEELPKITYTGGATYTLGAVMEAQKVFESARENAMKAVFLMTDGYSNAGDPRPAATELKEDGVKVFTFGIRNGNVRELRDMASEPKDEHSFILNSFEEFEALARRALHEDLKSGSFLQVDQQKCNALCLARDRCCDDDASCRCGTHTGHYECMCNVGFQGTGLRGRCHPCPENTYRNDTRAEECTKCPDRNHVSPRGSVSLFNCTCKHGFKTQPGGSCSTRRCPELTPPENGYFVKDSCGTAVNAVCGIRCLPGHELIGSSLRLCGLDGTWSGDEAICRIKKCSRIRKPEDGTMLCTKDDASFQTKCHFTCNTGYTLLGSSTRTCMAIAYWDGLTARCKEVRCVSLKGLNNGAVYPEECTDGRPRYGTTCHYSCKLGYKLVGPLSRSCLRDGIWSYADEKSVCIDATPPSIMCPNDVRTIAADGEATAEVDWEIPEAADNSGQTPSVRVMPAILPPKHFPIGSTSVKYIAEDNNGNEAYCLFAINVIDNEAPRVDSCISPEPVVSQKPKAKVTFEEPLFSDNSVGRITIKKSHEPGIPFPQGVTEVVYTAEDESGNNSTCAIRIDVREHPCSIPNSPLNGNVDCRSNASSVTCVVSCQKGFDFVFPPEKAYYCENDGVWKPEMPFPDCSPFKSPNDVVQQTEVVFSSAESCDDRLLIARAATGFQRQISNLVSDACGDNVVCTMGSFESNCKKSDKKFKSTNPSLRKRRSLTTDHARVNFGFKIQGTVFTDELKKNDAALLAAIGRVKDRLNKKASKGELNQKVGKKTVLQLEQINFFPDEPIFLCHQGSVLKDSACLKCPVGTIFNVISERCQSCDKGSYQPLQGQVSCMVCPDNSTTTRNNSKSIGECKAQCLPGTYSYNGLEMCQSCEIGSYQTSYAQTSCHPCPKGLTTWRRGTRRLEKCGVMCEPGFVSRTGLKPCFPCPRGYFQPNPGRSSCFRCPEKAPTLQAGSTKLQDCQGLKDEHRPNELAAELLINECFAEPCRNGGRCQGLAVGYICECPPGYSGLNCEFEIDECSSGPCQNNATCVDQLNKFVCICLDGYNGTHCQENIDDCTPSPCLNNATCQDGVNNYTCKCVPGFTGGDCETNIDDCAVNACLNNAQCIDGVLGYDCSCQPGFQGMLCEENIDECEHAPCLNGATCRDKINEFECECASGFLGLLCEIEIDECSSNPCKNGATCVEGIGSFSCSCAPSFAGKTCETELSSDFYLSFEHSGTIDHVMVEGMPNMTSMTVTFWMQTIDRSNYGTPISYALDNKRDNTFTLMDYSGFVLYINEQKVITDISANDGKWHHVVITWSSIGGKWRIYIDAELKEAGVDLGKGSTIQGGGRLVLGQEQDGFGSGFSAPESFLGNLTLLNIWNYELTTEQIRQLVTSCDEYKGSVKAWPDFLTGLNGRIRVLDSDFCQDCQSPEKIDMGTTVTTGLSISDTVTYSCKPGYEIIGSSIRVCKIYGSWDEKEPRCEKVRCGWPGRIRHGVTSGDYDFGGSVQYKCSKGYRLVGNDSRECMETGTWSGSAPLCEEITCPDLPLSKHWFFSGKRAKYTPGDEINIVCAEEFTRIGNGTLVCLDDGKWDYPFPTCVRNSCGDPPHVKNASADVEDGSFDGTRIEYSCDNGFRLEGRSTVQCLKNGSWEWYRPACNAILCPSLPIQFGSHSKPQYLVYDAIDVKCEKGYLLTGSGVFCNETGQWNATMPICLPVRCSKLSYPRNGVIRVESYSIGGTASYSCYKGYNMLGKAKRRCLTTGKWEFTEPICKRVECGLPDQIVNGSFSGDKFKFRNSVRYHCISDHALVGMAERECMADGTWSGSIPSCIYVKCPEPKPVEYGYVKVKGRGYNIIAEYSCHDTHVLKGNRVIKCQIDSNWNASIPVCNRVRCDHPGNITNGDTILEGLHIGASVDYHCFEDYKLIGSKHSICQKDFSWSAEPPNCSMRECKLQTNLDNGQVKVFDNEEGSVQKFSCNRGYHLLGDELRRCVNGSWTGIPPSCSFGCRDPPTITFGYSLSDPLDTFLPGDTVKYNCHKGYTAAKGEEATCQKDFNWSLPPVCSPVSCRTPESKIDFGKLIGTNFSYRAEIKYHCDDGYFVDGPITRTCEANGEWDRSEPNCQRVYCRTPEKIRRGWVLGDDYRFGSEVQIKCIRGYRLAGVGLGIASVTRKCLANGTWSGSDPTCELIECPEAGPFREGNVVLEGVGIEAVLKYVCRTGYKMIGSSRRRCRDTGFWAGFKPSCHMVDCNSPPSIENGDVEYDDTLYENAALLDCHQGFVLKGPTAIYCQADGRWSKPLAKCQRKNCSTPSNITNGKVSFLSLEYEATVSYECNYGYTIVGNTVRKCGNNGKWVGDKPTCEQVICDPPLEVTNGYYKSLGIHSIDSTIEVSCKVGFRLSGPSVLVCLEDHRWSDGPPSCVSIECDAIPNIRDGLTIGSTRYVNDTHRFKCNEGYKLIGENTLTCTESGVWSGKVPRCEIINCPALGKIDNGKTESNNNDFSYGTSVRYICDTGYEIVGPLEIICQANKTWSAEQPKCDKVACFPLPDTVENGQIDVSGSKFGDNATIKCDPGYNLVGMSELHCNSDGSWTSSIPQCHMKMCSNPGPIDHGSIEGDNYSFGSRISYVCDVGFRLLGDAQLLCGEDGNWDMKAPMCERIVCPYPDHLENGTFNDTGAYFKDVITYTCKKGFKLIGSQVRYCENTSTWSGLPPKCEIITCPFPDIIDNGSIKNPMDIYEFGGVIIDQCDVGYELTEHGGRRCLDDGTWSKQLAFCRQITCPEETPPRGGSIVLQSNVYGGILKYACDVGYETNESRYRICLDNGTWSGGAPRCNKVNCPELPLIKNGTYSATGLRYQDEVAYECTIGFALIGPEIISCLASGSWSAEPPFCERITCPPPDDVPRGNMKGNEFYFNMSVAYDCIEGHRLTGDKIRFCREDKTWSGQMPSCDVILCPKSNVPTNGYMISDGQEYGSLIEYECIDGFKLIGDKVRACASNGTWTGTTPECQEINCPDFLDIPNGYILKKKNNVGSVVEHYCFDGYELEGEVQRKCQENGTWTGSEPECKITRCPEPPSIDNGEIFAESYDFGSKLLFTCHEGYVRKGPEYVTCTAYRIWNDSLPSCVKLECPHRDSLQNGEIVGEDTDVGALIEYKCGEGYALIGDPFSMCKTDGTWSSKIPKCRRVVCDEAPSVPNATKMPIIDENGRISAVYYKCEDGYDIEENDLLICEPPHWFGKLPKCRESLCTTLPYVANASAIRYENKEVQYICDRGFRLSGDDILRCFENGTWFADDEFPSCEILQCGPPPVTDEYYVVSDDGSTFGSTIFYECIAGYVLHGEPNVTCLDTGNWSNPGPDCVPVSCSKPVPVDNSRIDGDVYTFGATIRYICDEGFQMVGLPERKCMENGKWSSEMPTCKEISCAPPPQPPNGKVIGDSYDVGDSISFGCDPEFNLIGDVNSTCTANGTWSTEIPFCKGLSCPTIPDIPRTIPLLHDDFTVGDTVILSCKPGYKSHGSMSITCINQKEWSTCKGSCKKISCGRPALLPGVQVIMGRSYLFEDRVAYVCRPGLRPDSGPVLKCLDTGQWSGETRCKAFCKYPCKNGGLCVAENKCACPSGYSGSRCEGATCILPCLHGGTCVGPYKCECRGGYKGSRCQTVVCSKPCANNGYCMRPNRCLCPRGFKQPFCEEHIPGMGRR